MSFLINIKEGNTNKQYKVYTKNEIDQIINRQSRLVVRVNEGGNFGGTGGGDIELTEDEIAQLQNINNVTITNTQWGYLGDQDQSLSTSDSPTFVNLVLNGTLTTGNDITVDDGTNSIVLDISNQRIVFNDSNQTDLVLGHAGAEGTLYIDFGPLAIGTTTAEGYTGANIDGSVQIKSILDLTGNLTLGGLYETDNFQLTTDFSGIGHQATNAGDYNIRNLVVRESARFRELIIDQLGIIAGSDLRSIARGKIRSVDAGSNQVTLENPNDRAATTWVNNDFFWVKSVDVDGGIFLDLQGQVSNVNIDGSNNIILTLDTTVSGGTHSGGSTDISDLSPGDVLVQRGHPTNSGRQALIYTTVSDNDAPVQKYFTGVDSLNAFNQTAHISTQIGVLDALNSVYSNVSGEGIFSSNAFFTDSVLIGDLAKNDNYLDYQGSSLIINTDTYRLDTPDLDIDSSVPRIDIGNSHFLNGNTDIASFSSGVLVADGPNNEVTLAGLTAKGSRIFTGSSPNFVGMGATSSDTDRAFWAGAPNSDGSGNTAWYVQQNGRFFSEAASDVIWSRTELATFSNNTFASSISNEYWQSTTSRTSNGTSSLDHVKIRTVRQKKFSKDRLQFSGFGMLDGQTGGGGGSVIVERNVEVRADISSISGTETASGFADIPFTSDTEFSFDVDISAIPDDDLMLIEIILFVEITINNYDSGTYTTEGYLREDVSISTAT